MDHESSHGGTAITAASLRKAVKTLPCGEVRFFDRVASTNDIAREWLLAGAPDVSLVYAEEQTAGKGRLGRTWFSSPGQGLTFSLALRLGSTEIKALSLFTGLGAIAVCVALERLKLKSQVKWPNDVLLRRRKVCGVLAEMLWHGDVPVGVILGIGVNVASGSVPGQETLQFPATCVEAEYQGPVDRLALLHDILQSLFAFQQDLKTAMLVYWRTHLAFNGEMVELISEGLPPRHGVIRGLADDGSLLLQEPGGSILSIPQGVVRLVPRL
jgi:BirA family biotin operon repressor/biotin-[acetyl-CoA-carboxylase] ligase